MPKVQYWDMKIRVEYVNFLGIIKDTLLIKVRAFVLVTSALFKSQGIIRCFEVFFMNW